VVSLSKAPEGLWGGQYGSTAQQTRQLFGDCLARQPQCRHAPWGGGAFTHALVEVLNGNWRSADLNGNGLIEVSELYRALRSIVAAETPGQQRPPWLARADLIGDFALF